MKRAVLFDVGDTLILGHPKFWLWPLLLERGLTPDTSRLREAIAAAYAEYNRRHLEAISPSWPCLSGVPFTGGFWKG